MISTLDEFIEKYKEICDLGWIKTHRAGDTGIGKTLEDLLGIEENNKGEPDFGDYELKASRVKASNTSMLTLFTKEPNDSVTKLFEKFSYEEKGKPKLHATLSADKYSTIKNNVQLKINIKNNKVSIVDNSQKEYAYWEYSALKEQISNKYKNKFIYAKALSRNKEKDEEFRFILAYKVDINFEKFENLLKEGKIYVDIRIGRYPNGKIHNHGTGFRVKQDDIFRFFTAEIIVDKTNIVI